MPLRNPIVWPHDILKTFPAQRMIQFSLGVLFFQMALPAFARSTGSTGSQSKEQLVRMLSYELIAGFVLFMVFLVGSFVMVRAMRRTRNIVMRSDPVPTQSEDVWKMHKLPNDALDDDPFEENV